jgi:predicted ArsR family transcriptional regulator
MAFIEVVVRSRRRGRPRRVLRLTGRGGERLEVFAGAPPAVVLAVWRALSRQAGSGRC